MRTRKKSNNHKVAEELSTEEVGKILEKVGKLIKEFRLKRSSLDDFAYEISISRSALARYETGGDMLLSSFLKVSYGLEIDTSDFFKRVNAIK